MTSIPELSTAGLGVEVLLVGNSRDCMGVLRLEDLIVLDPSTSGVLGAPGILKCWEPLGVSALGN